MFKPTGPTGRLISSWRMVVVAAAIAAGALAVATTPAAAATATPARATGPTWVMRVTSTAQLAAPGNPAQAQLSLRAAIFGKTAMCLINSADNACIGFNGVDIAEAVAAVSGVGTGIAVYVKGIFEGYRTIRGRPGSKHLKFEMKVTGGTDKGKCLGAKGGYASWTTCGANGTVWVKDRYSNGYRFYSNYSLNRGNLRVLTAVSATGNGRLDVRSPSSKRWQTWI
jgi:hypothetical protein